MTERTEATALVEISSLYPPPRSRKAVRKSRKPSTKLRYNVSQHTVKDEADAPKETLSNPPDLENSITYECCICGDETQFTAGVAACASHFLCNECTVNSYEMALGDIQAFPARCCTPLARRLVEHLLSAALRTAYSLRAQEYYTPRTLRVYCSREMCGVFIHPSRFDNTSAFATVARCECGAKTCVGCKQVWKGASHCCVDSASKPAWLPPYSPTCRIKQCPGCGLWIEHKDACNHMTCCYCSQQFCFICLLPWEFTEGFHESEGCPSYGDPSEGYDDEGYERTERGLHRDTGFSRAGRNRLGHERVSYLLRSEQEEEEVEDGLVDEWEQYQWEYEVAVDEAAADGAGDWDVGFEVRQQQQITWMGEAQEDLDVFLEELPHTTDPDDGAATAAATTTAITTTTTTTTAFPAEQQHWGPEIHHIEDTNDYYMYNHHDAGPWREIQPIPQPPPPPPPQPEPYIHTPVHTHRHIPLLAPNPNRSNRIFDVKTPSYIQLECRHTWLSRDLFFTAYDAALCRACRYVAPKWINYCSRCSIIACNYCSSDLDGRFTAWLDSLGCMVDVLLWAEQGGVPFKRDRARRRQRRYDDVWGEGEAAETGIAVLFAEWEERLFAVQPFLYGGFHVEVMFGLAEREMRSRWWPVDEENVGVAGCSFTFNMARNTFAPLLWAEEDQGEMDGV